MGGKGVLLTQDEYEDRVREKRNGTIEVRGEYKGYYRPLRHYCTLCDKEFTQIPDLVIRNTYGCPFCSDRILKERKDKEYKEKLAKKYKGNVICLGTYSGHNVPLLHTCKTCEAQWKLSPTFMLLRRGTGCKECTYKEFGKRLVLQGGHEYQRKSREIREKEYKEKLKKLTDGNITISKKNEFRNAYIDLIHYCKKHKKTFLYRPINLAERSGHLLMCPDCIEESKESPLKSEAIRNRIKAKFGNKIKIKVLNKSHLQSVFECKECHNVWETRYGNLLNSVVGCPQCGRLQAASKTSYSNEEYLKQLHQINKSYSIHDDYVSEAHPLIHYCSIHNIEWEAKPSNVKDGCCICPECAKSKRPTSRLADEWLAERAERDGVKIRTHKSKKGEYSIKLSNGSTVRVDGFCKKTNTVYEFYGDLYHGNPRILNPDDHCHPYKKEETAYSLLKATIEREAQIRMLGYNVVSIWESDYLKGML